MTPRVAAGLLGVMTLLAACSTIAQTAPEGGPPPLGGTAWRLVKFEGGDERTFIPDDGGKYTIEFHRDGRLTVRIDCDRGRGTWTSPAPGRLELSPLALTRRVCPSPSLHDRIVRDWTHVRSYVVRNGRLFLSLMADGGIYEFEPISGRLGSGVITPSVEGRADRAARRPGGSWPAPST